MPSVPSSTAGTRRRYRVGIDSLRRIAATLYPPEVVARAVVVLWMFSAASVAQSLERPLLDRPTPEARETEWSAWLAQQLGGKPEHRLLDGARVDVLTDSIAWEVEWVNKWPESIGQAIYYRAATGRRGGVVLLVGRGDLKREAVYWLRALVACREADLTLRVVDVRPRDR